MRRILVAVDFTDTTSEVVRWGAELARALHRQLVIVNVAEPVPDWALSMGEGPIPSIPSRTDYTERDMESRHAALLGIKERLTDEDFEVDVRVLRGRSADEITRAMDEFKPYMIVIGSHRRGALQQLFGRNVGSKVVRKAPCPVVVVHPDDRPEDQGTTGTSA